jgi:hypothetical protein
VLRPKVVSRPVLARRAAALCALPALLALPACGDSSEDDGHTHPEACKAADTFAPNLSKTGAAGVTVTITEASPAVPLARIDGAWKVRVTDASGAPIEGATLEMKQKMPSHSNHGVSREAASTDVGGGVYELNPVLFTMDGAWTVPIEVTQGATTDTVEFEFCIEG